MISNKQCFFAVAMAFVVLVVLQSQCDAQTLTYSAGWTNGKRSGEMAFGHHDHGYASGGPVPISDLQTGRNFLCFDINPQLKDILVSVGLKSPDYSRPLVARPLLRNQE